MRNLIFVVALFASVPSGPLFLEPQSEQPSPKGVVEEFCKFETAGGRLTPQGWKEAERFFVRPLPQPKKKTILVTAKPYSVWDPIFRNENKADVIVGVTGNIWKMDADMRLSLDSPDQSKSFLSYSVFRTKNQSESGASPTATHEVTGTPEWKIDGAGETIWLTADTAIRYVNHVHDKTSNPVVRQNAEKTLIRLKRLLRQGG